MPYRPRNQRSDAYYAEQRRRGIRHYQAPNGYYPHYLYTDEEMLEQDLAPLVYGRQDDARYLERLRQAEILRRENIMIHGHPGGPWVWRGQGMRRRVRRDRY